jgi:uncharacterized DUF497 family protein
MEFDGFDWDDGNRAKCCKHGVGLAEIEFVLANPDYLSEDPTHSIHEQRSIAVGSGPGGRVMFVAFTVRKLDGMVLLRPVSTRYMHEKEFRRYVGKNRD